MKIINDTERYRIVQWKYEGLPVTFRFWKFTDIVEIRVDEYFAKANGYTSVKDMVNQTVGQAKMDELFGGVPDWIRASPNGDFTFVGVERSLLN